MLQLPEPDPAEDAGSVVDDLHAVSEVDRELLRVAATDVEPVDVQERVEHLHRLEDAFAPPPVPDATPGLVPELVLEGATALERHEGQLQVRGGDAVEEHRRPEPRAEGQHQLEAITGDHR